jgi:hypothetical protein
VTEPDDELRRGLRDLIPDYAGPVDPVPAIAARVGRARRRSLLTLCATALAVALAVLVPVSALSGDGRPAAYRGAVVTAPVPLTGPAPARQPPAAVHPVAAGWTHGLRWTVGSTTLSPDARRCLRADGAVVGPSVACFDDWAAGGPATWVVLPAGAGEVTVTWIGGVTPGPAVRIRLDDGLVRTLPAVSTRTDRAARFFGTVIDGRVAVLDVTMLDASGTPVGRPLTDPGQPCRPNPGAVCAEEIRDR